MIDLKLVRLFVVRFLIALVAVAGATLYFVWQPYLAAKRLITSQKTEIEQASDDLERTRDIIETLPDPGTLPIQSPRTNRDYVNDVTKALEKVTPIDLELPAPIRNPSQGRFGTELVGRVNGVLTDPSTKQAYEAVESVLTEADRLLTYHAAMSYAVANVLDYNPSMDFQQFTLGDEDTGARIDAARGGLQKAKERVEEAKKLYDDKLMDEIVASIAALGDELDLLEKSGDLARFSGEFKKRQEKVRTNRAAFWLSASQNITAQLSGAVANLGKVSERWFSIRR